jgi:flagellar capping protein FliD
VHGHDLREGIRLIRTLTDKPIGFNALIEKSSKIYEDRMRKWVDVALEEGVRFFITALGNPKWVADKVHAVGGVVSVTSLAREARKNSAGQASSNTALGINAQTLNFAVGGGTAQSITIQSSDTLDDVAGKINALGGKFQASVIDTGISSNPYVLQIRGLDTGASKDLEITGSAVAALGLDQVQVGDQSAANAKFTLDNVPIERGTNTVTDAIAGVTLTLAAPTAQERTITVEADGQGLKDKLKGFVDAYNAVVKRIHTEAGHGSQKASNPVLAGDSSLRSITRRLGDAVLKGTGGAFEDSLASIGVRFNQDGTLQFKESELADAVAKDPSKVQHILGGSGGQDGVMDLLRDLVGGFTQTGTGLLATRKESLNDRADVLNQRITKAEQRIDLQAELLRKQFTAMDSAVAANNATLDYLIRMSVG